MSIQDAGSFTAARSRVSAQDIHGHRRAGGWKLFEHPGKAVYGVHHILRVKRPDS